MRYKGVCKEYGKSVKAEHAFGYALSRILQSKEEEEEFVDWYYSGNWVKTYDDEENTYGWIWQDKEKIKRIQVNRERVKSKDRVS